MNDSRVRYHSYFGKLEVLKRPKYFCKRACELLLASSYMWCLLLHSCLTAIVRRNSRHKYRRTKRQRCTSGCCTRGPTPFKTSIYRLFKAHYLKHTHTHSHEYYIQYQENEYLSF